MGPWFAAVLSLVLLVATPGGVKAEHFPLYDEIRPNVAFWQDIYSRYYSSQGLLHDSYRLEIVYTVLEVENSWDNAARRRNQAKIDAARDHYRAILRHLAAGNPPRNAEERRVLALFGADPDREQLRRAVDNIRFQRGLRDRFQEGVIRSGAYLDQIKEILRQHGVPEDLAYLPHVESSFNYEAYSRVGAAGIWQFMQSTGRQYLTVDYVLDERRDPIRASHAAARLLLDNHSRLGNWPLAISAYNHGPTGMARAVAAHGDYPTIFREYSGNRFGFASRNFYPEFLAAREVAKNASRYFGALALEPERRSHEIVLPGYVPVKELAANLRLDLDTLRRYNQGLREPVFAGEKHIPKGYRLRVPASAATIRLASALPTSLWEESQKRSAFYMVRRGDTAGEIARRHGVSLPTLIAANQLGSRATIYAGQNLRIPGRDDTAVRLAAATPAPKTRAAAATPVPQAPVVAATPVTATAARQPVATAALESQPVVSSGGRSVPGWVASAPPVPAAPVLEGPAQQVGGAEVTVAAVAAPPAPAVAPVVVAGAESPRPRLARVMLASARDGDWSLLAAEAVVRESLPVNGAAAGAALVDSRVALALSGDSARLPAKTPVEAGAGLPDPLAVNPAVVSGNIPVEQVWQERDGRLVGYIRVEVEETLGHYAEWLGIRTQELRRLNGFSFGQAIRHNQRIKIPLDQVDQAGFEEQRYEFHKGLEEDFFAAYRVEGLRVHVVRRGDSIWGLARDDFELPLWLIRKYNPGLELDNLQPGNEIRVPVVGGSAAFGQG